MPSDWLLRSFLTIWSWFFTCSGQNYSNGSHLQYPGMISSQLWTIWLLSAVISTFKAYLLFLCMHRVIMARGAPGLQFRSLILHLYQTPGGKQAQNRHDVSNLSLRFIPRVSLCVALIHNKQVKCHQQAFASLHTSAVHMSISSRQSSSAEEFFKGLPTSALVQRASY